MKNIIDILTDNKILPSKGEARMLTHGGAIKVNDKVVRDPQELFEGHLIIRVGKKIGPIYVEVK